MSSIRDVARRAGVSPATVSRILNNDPTYRTTAETRQNVLRAVTELNYKPLVKKRKKEERGPEIAQLSIGCVMVSTKGKYSDPYFLSILSGVEQELEKHGGAVTVIHTTQELENPDTLNAMLNMRLDGLILMCRVEEWLFRVLYERFPFIVGVDTGHYQVDSVEYDHARVSRMAVEYLYSRGHRKIGFIGGGVWGGPIERSRRFRSYRNTMRDLELEVRPDWVLDCGWDDRQCMKMIERVYKSGEMPTAFYASSDLMAMAALRMFYQLGVKVPDDVAVIGMSNIEMSKYANPPLTTIDVPTIDIGITVARTLLSRIQGDTTLPKQIQLPSRLIVRDSV